MKVEICVGAKCTMLGAEHILDNVEHIRDEVIPAMGLNGDVELDIEVKKCLNYCKPNNDVAPVVVIDGEPIFKTNSQNIMARIMDKIEKK